MLDFPACLARPRLRSARLRLNYAQQPELAQVGRATVVPGMMLAPAAPHGPRPLKASISPLSRPGIGVLIHTLLAWRAIRDDGLRDRWEDCGGTGLGLDGTGPQLAVCGPNAAGICVYALGKISPPRVPGVMPCRDTQRAPMVHPTWRRQRGRHSEPLASTRTC